MNSLLMKLVWESSVGGHAPKLVLVAIASTLDGDGFSSISILEIMRMCELSRQGVVNILGNLAKSGVIGVTKRRRHKNAYTVVAERLSQLPKVESSITKSGERIGSIYFIGNTRNGLVKIGFSTVPDKREKTLQSEEPELVTIYRVDGVTIGDEKMIHRRFSKKRMRGEWFALDSSEESSAISLAVECSEKRSSK